MNEYRKIIREYLHNPYLETENRKYDKFSKFIVTYLINIHLSKII